MTRGEIDDALLAYVAELTAEVDRLEPLFAQTKDALNRTTLARNFAVISLLALRDTIANTASPEFSAVIHRARRIAEAG